jgi:hypothetical protein
MLGNMVVNKVLLNAFKPDIVKQIEKWMERGKVVKISKTKKECVYTIDHPDFIEADPPYDYHLHFKRIYGFDGDTYCEHNVISSFSYSADGKYLGEVKYHA